MPHSVMVIDDCTLQRYITETMVKRTLPIERIISFHSPIEALEHLRALESASATFPSVIFLDIHMPVMNGFGFLDDYLRFSDASRAHCKIVILSSTKVGEDFARARKYPSIYKFLSKPMSDEMIDDVSALWQTGKKEE